MNRKIILLALFFLILSSSVFAATLSVTRTKPSSGINTVWIPVGPVQFEYNVTCTVGPCENVTFTSEYCKEPNCGTYALIPRTTGPSELGQYSYYYNGVTQTLLNPGNIGTIQQGNTVRVYGNLYVNQNNIQVYQVKQTFTSSNASTINNPVITIKVHTRQAITLNNPQQITTFSNPLNVTAFENIALNWTITDPDPIALQTTIYYNPGANCPLTSTTIPTYYAGTTHTIYNNSIMPGTYNYNWSAYILEEGKYCVWAKTVSGYTVESYAGWINVSVPQKIDVNNLAGDTAEPYIDGINDEKTEFTINVLTPGDASQCKVVTDIGTQADRIWISEGTDFPFGASTITFDLKNEESGNWIPWGEGHYTYYYECNLKSFSSNWTPYYTIEFDINFLAGLAGKIVSPKTGDYFVVGDEIDFRANITANGYPYTVEWSSDKDPDWKPTDENFSFDGLSIATHKITLKTVFDYNKTGTIEKITRTDSVNINVTPIPLDVLGITSFTVVPETNLTQADTINVTAVITNAGNTPKDPVPFLRIINAETGEQVFSETKKNLMVPAHGSIQVSFNISLAAFEQANYKINLDVAEYDKEQNKENNHATTIITVLKAPREVNAPEINEIAVIFVVLSVLAIIKKNN